MTANTLIFLAQDSPPALVLLRLKKLNDALNVVQSGEMVVLQCGIEPSDGGYLCVEIPSPVKEHPQASVKLMIPHAFVLLAVDAGQKAALGFGKP